ncbi:MAG: FAD-dependent oxidoreductase [Cytophagales bacterium]|nr:FAD-dependent oxidoreductase [Cytophagales bacterium]
MKVHIIGGGIIGLFSAYYLAKEGVEVTVIDKENGDQGCSTINAGLICPSHIVPLAAPGVMSKSLKWMLDSSSPFYVKPSLDWSLIKWGLLFMKSACQKKVDESMPVLRDFLTESRSLYQQFQNVETYDFGFEKKGLLLLCKTNHFLEEEAHVGEKARALGMKVKTLNRKEVIFLEPESTPDVEGAVYYPDDAHCNPAMLIAGLKRILKAKGVQFLYNTEVVSIDKSEQKVKGLTLRNTQGEKMELPTDQVILAAGSWSRDVALMFQLTIPLQAGKGYSFTKQQQACTIHYPAILCEKSVAVTPWTQNTVRFAGTMELAGLNDKVNLKRVAAIAKAAEEYYPGLEVPMPAKDEIMFGMRPCSPDGLPYIGKASNLDNLTIATGHAMLGLTLAPATGKMVSEIVLRPGTQANNKYFAPDRFERLR